MTGLKMMKEAVIDLPGLVFPIDCIDIKKITRNEHKILQDKEKFYYTHDQNRGSPM